MTAQRDATTGSAQNRILDAAEAVICTRGIAAFTLNAVAQAAGVSKGGLLYHFNSKDSLVSGLQRRMASRIATSVQEAEGRSEPILQAFVRQLRQDYERGGQSFAALLLAREQEKPCEELQTLMACLSQRSSVDGDSRPTLLLLAAFGLILSNLARLPCPAPEHASTLFDELEAIAARVN
jgi:AcrR family transcriptional regulator